MGRALLLLAGAIAFEVLFAVMLKVSRGFTVLWPSVITVVAYTLSLVFLNFACRHFDLSVAYAVWTGTAAVMVALIGFIVFHERLGAARAMGLGLVVCGVVVLIGLEKPTAAPDPERALGEPVWDLTVWQPGLDNGDRLLGDMWGGMPPVLRPPLLPGTVAPFVQQCLHVVLGRGLTRQDQAFVRGFALGAAAGCPPWRLALHRFCARRLYPAAHRFSPLDCQVLDFAFQAARRAGVPPLRDVPFHTLMHRPLGEVRDRLGIRTEALYLLYDAERTRWPGSAARPPRPASCYLPRAVTTQLYSRMMLFPRPVGA